MVPVGAKNESAAAALGPSADHRLKLKLHLVLKDAEQRWSSTG